MRDATFGPRRTAARARNHAARSVAEFPAVARDDSCYAVHQEVEGIREVLNTRAEISALGMGVNVDEPGCQHPLVSVNNPLRGRLTQPSDSGNPSLLDSYIRQKPGSTRAISHTSVPDDEVIALSHCQSGSENGENCSEATWFSR